MLGVLMGQVNEDGTPMDAGKAKSRDFRFSQALAYPVVKKGSSAAAASAHPPAP
jgi:hypothetical protein